jgi:3-deoxy-D-manno-octulosonic-acid transferase
MQPILKKVTVFCMQAKRDAQRIIRLGVNFSNVYITGNMKFDIKDYADLKKDYSDIKKKLGLSLKNKLLVAGSTHAGEEGIILSVYQKLLIEFPDLRLFIAPRHPQRAFEIEKLIVKYNFLPLKISQLSTLNPQLLAVFILDTIGQLPSFYAIADLVFVGGSLIKKGGHNILEPAALARPILFGPHMFNFRDISRLYLKNEAAIMVRNQEELKLHLTQLLSNPDKSGELGRRARQLILDNQGATQRNLAEISKAVVHLQCL